MVGFHLQPPPHTQEADADPHHVYTTATSSVALTSYEKSTFIREGSLQAPPPPPSSPSTTDMASERARCGSVAVVYDGRCEYGGSSVGGDGSTTLMKGGGLISEAQYRKGVQAYNTKEYCSSTHSSGDASTPVSCIQQPPFLLSAMGSWLIQPPTTDGEPIRHWIPHTSTEPHWRRFSSQDARKCLDGTRVVFVGNSNTRTLYTALEALLRDTPMMSRLGAKQLCDNRQSNHSCWASIEGGGTTSTQLHYVSYVKDLYDSELEERVANPFGFGKRGVASQQRRSASEILFFNTGLNVIQGQHDPQWIPEHKKNAPKLEEFLTRYLRKSSMTPPPARMPYFVWHPTTRLCPHQTHFKRYKYKPKVWRGRTLEQTNEAAAVSNSLIRPVVDRLRSIDSSSLALTEKEDGHMTTRSSSAGNADSRVQIIEGDEMLLAPEVVLVAAGQQQPVPTLGESSPPSSSGTSGSKYPNHLCPLYDDPLHHRFYDREVIQVFLNRYCNG